MEFPRDPDKQNQLIYEATMKSNELLAQLIALLTPKEVETVKEEPVMKRPAMIKLISSMKNKPSGFQTWSNDKLSTYLKEANHDKG